LERDLRFLAGLHRAEVPDERPVGRLLGLRAGLDELRAGWDVVGDDDILGGSAAGIANVQGKSGWFTDLNFRRRDFFERDGGLLRPFELTLARRWRGEALAEVGLGRGARSVRIQSASAALRRVGGVGD
jgi:hypothetical protein